MDRKLIIISAGLFVALISGAMIIAWLVTGQHSKSSASIVDATQYKPQSRWMEEGLDPDVSTFEMAAPPLHEKRIDDDAMVHTFVQNHYADLMPCYQAALDEEDVAGRLDMRFGVKTDGTIALVEVIASELESPVLEDCAVETARHWRLPPTGKENLMKFDADFRFSYE